MISEKMKLLADFLEKEVHGVYFNAENDAGENIGKIKDNLEIIQEFVNKPEFFYEIKSRLSFNFQLINFAVSCKE